MVQSFFRGPTATAFLSSLVPSSLTTLPEWTSTLSVLLNETGGIIDDTILTKHSEGEWYVVTNAGRRAEDLAWFGKKLEEWNAKEGKVGGHVVMEVLEGWGLIALQGELLSSPSSLSFRELISSSRSFVLVLSSQVPRPSTFSSSTLPTIFRLSTLDKLPTWTLRGSTATSLEGGTRERTGSR